MKFYYMFWYCLILFSYILLINMGINNESFILFINITIQCSLPVTPHLETFDCIHENLMTAHVRYHFIRRSWRERGIEYTALHFFHL